MAIWVFVRIGISTSGVVFICGRRWIAIVMRRRTHGGGWKNIAAFVMKGWASKRGGGLLPMVVVVGPANVVMIGGVGDDFWSLCDCIGTCCSRNYYASH